MKTTLLRTLLFTTLFTLCCTAFSETTVEVAKTPARPTEKIQNFIQGMVKNHGFSKKKLTALMNKAKYNPNVIARITHPFEKKSWDFYRSFFITKERIEGGVAYLKTHEKTFAAVKKRYGVPPSIIAAIIAVESKFGTHLGKYNELSALTTLAFYYKPRSKFFKKELKHFLLLTRKQKLTPEEIQGSYAGALGIPQFMPSSYRHYAVDYSKNKSIDLINDHNDAIASVANYLKKAGWKTNQPIAVPAKIIGKVPTKLISKRAKPKLTVDQLEDHNVFAVEKEPLKLKAALIAMQNTDSTEYWIVFQNFRAIMRYNPSTTYSLAVYELSQAIKNEKSTASARATSQRAAKRS